jgi:hypothetical protein
MKHLIVLSISLLYTLILSGQTQEDLLARKAEKEAELATLQPQLTELTGKVNTLKNEIDLLTDQTKPYPRWDVGAYGNAGFNLAQFTNWLSKASPNTTAFTIGLTSNGFANLQQPKYFWRNNASLTLGWLKFDDRDDPTDSKDFKVSADACDVTSLYGYKLSEKLALSSLGEYRTSLLDDRFNNPGYLDIGAGLTWTPIVDLVVVMHPVNYNFVFSKGDFDYQSSLGAKLLADYKKEIVKGIAWKSSLSAFISYKSSDLSNWSWVNGLTTSRKGIGIGLDVGLRGNKQEALAAGRTDNPLQSYWIIGLSYSL